MNTIVEVEPVVEPEAEPEVAAFAEPEEEFEPAVSEPEVAPSEPEVAPSEPEFGTLIEINPNFASDWPRFT